MTKFYRKSKEKFFKKEELENYAVEIDGLNVAGLLPDPVSCPLVTMYNYHCSFGIWREEMKVVKGEGIRLSKDAKLRIRKIHRERVQSGKKQLMKSNQEDAPIAPPLNLVIWHEMVEFFSPTELPSLLQEVSQIGRLGAAAEEVFLPKLWTFHLHKKNGLTRDLADYHSASNRLRIPVEANLKNFIIENQKVSITLEELLDPEYWDSVVAYCAVDGESCSRAAEDSESSEDH